MKLGNDGSVPLQGGVPDEEIVLERTAESVAAALATTHQKTRLGDCQGLAAIFCFLRISLRVKSRPLSWRGKASNGFKGILSQEAASTLIHAGCGKPEQSDRNLVASLERKDRDNLSRLHEFKLGIVMTYLGAPKIVTVGEREPLKVCHTVEPYGKWQTACWIAITKANNTTLVSEFANKCFGHLRQSAPHEMHQPSDSTNIAWPSQATDKAPSDASVESIPTDFAYVLSIDAIKSRETVLRRYVSSMHLPSRRDQIEKLSRCVSLSQTHALAASHCLAVVAGQHGVGKSEFIYEWLLHERDRQVRRFDDVLFITDSSSLTEDLLVKHVREYLAAQKGTPLIVLDGLRVQNGNFFWDYDSLNKARPDPTQSELAGFLKSQIGKRPFVAVFGVQTFRRTDSGVPKILESHPRIPHVPLHDLITLAPLPIEEARTFVSGILGPGPKPTDAVERIVKFSDGLPLRLAALAAPEVLESKTDFSAVSSLAFHAREKRLREQITGVVRLMDVHDGETCAVMRLASLFRRPQSSRHIEAVAQSVLQAGQSIGRIRPGTILEVAGRSHFFSMPGADGGVALVDAMRSAVEEELAHQVRVNPHIEREVRAIHLVAARMAFKMFRAQDDFCNDDDRIPDTGRNRTQSELEFACDAAFHLLGTRGLTGPSLVLGGDEDGLSSTARKVFQGDASDDEIDRFCFSEILHRAQLNGSAFSSRGLFALKLGLLQRFFSAWGSSSSDTRISTLRRSVRFEFAACSLVAGDLDAAEAELRPTLKDLWAIGSDRTAVMFREEKKHNPQTDGDAVDHCEELSKVVSTLASLQLRRGRINDAKKDLNQALGQVILPSLKWANSDQAHQWKENFRRRQMAKIHRALCRVLSRLAEISFFSVGTPGLKDGRHRTLDETLEQFDQAEREHAILGAIREPDVAQYLPPAERQAVVYRLSGESGKAYVRALVRQAQMVGKHTKEGLDYIRRSRELIDAQLGASQELTRIAGWSNDAISFGLLRAASERLGGRFDVAVETLANVESDPRYRNLGACSLAVRFELRLERAKLALASPTVSSGQVLPDAIRSDLIDLVRDADQTGHRTLQLDGALLLAIAATGNERSNQLQEARTIYENCTGCRHRDDVFAWAEHGATSHWSELSLAI